MKKSNAEILYKEQLYKLEKLAEAFNNARVSMCEIIEHWEVLESLTHMKDPVSLNNALVGKRRNLLEELRLVRHSAPALRRDYTNGSKLLRELTKQLKTGTKTKAKKGVKNVKPKQ